MFASYHYKIATVKPLCKTGDKHNFMKYRPVSLLTQFSKILEKLFRNRVEIFLEMHKLLNNCQYGLRTLPIRVARWEVILLDLVIFGIWLILLCFCAYQDSQQSILKSPHMNMVVLLLFGNVPSIQSFNRSILYPVLCTHR